MYTVCTLLYLFHTSISKKINFFEKAGSQESHKECSKETQKYLTQRKIFSGINSGSFSLEFRTQTLQPSLSICQRKEKPKQMAKAWEGPKMFKTQSSAARVLGGGHHDLAGGRMRPLLQTTGAPGKQSWRPWASHALLVLRLSEAACQILPCSIEPDFQTLPRRATNIKPICLPDKPGGDWLSYPNSGRWSRSDCLQPLLPARNRQ